MVTALIRIVDDLYRDLSSSVRVVRVSDELAASLKAPWSAEQLATRLLSEESQVSSDRIRRGDISQRDFDKFVHVSREVASLPIDIDDTPAITLSALRTRARRLKRTKGLALVVVDHIQLMRPAAGTKPDNRGAGPVSCARPDRDTRGYSAADS